MTELHPIFFMGNNHVLPDILRNAYMLITPVVTVIVVTLVYSLGFKRFFKRPAALRKPG
ncbi:hypothetical protein GCM10009092_35790 [Bowmanella denitrificans]|uniref:Uncharacterized protein n=1 Tax=Bowmanella denitrificans TaxID=366582 RepID=A0ABP3HF83_9ALTE